MVARCNFAEINMTASIVCPVAVLSIDYPEGPFADALEAEVLRTLPQLSGLEGAQTEGERMEVYARAIDEQRDEFIAMYGDPFGWEKRAVPREPSMDNFGRFLGAAVGAE